MNVQKKPLVVVMGGAVAVSLAAASVAGAAENPFAATVLSSGYQVAEADAKVSDVPADSKGSEEDKMKDGMCAAGKCGSSMKKKKAKAKADGAEKAKEGNCGSEKKSHEGKCGSSN
ncbi:MAG: hypothetical protein N2Z69_01520 [Methylophilaceae bacterium]|nr:hypothetical protein [Methylophilaceae bacterium]